MARGMKKYNGYACSIDQALYEKIPKAVFAAIAISALTHGGDYLEKAEAELLAEWDALYCNGIVPQKPIRRLTDG